MIGILLDLLVLAIIVIAIFLAVDMFSPDSRLTKLVKFVVGAIALIIALKMLLPLLGSGHLL